MNIWTPYTKDALTRIKNGATAADLGWDDLFYYKVCRDHGLPRNDIKLVKTQAIPEIAAPSISCSQATARPGKKRQATPTAMVLPDETVLENYNVLRQGKITIHLSPAQAGLLRMLVKLSGDELTADRLSVALGVSLETVKVYTSQVRVTLRRIGIIMPRLTQKPKVFVLLDKFDRPAKIRIIGASA